MFLKPLFLLFMGPVSLCPDGLLFISNGRLEAASGVYARLPRRCKVHVVVPFNR